MHQLDFVGEVGPCILHAEGGSTIAGRQSNMPVYPARPFPRAVDSPPAGQL